MPGVPGVTAVQTTDATVAGSAHQNVDGVDPAAIGEFTSLGLRSGSLRSLASGALLVSQSAATDTAGGSAIWSRSGSALRHVPATGRRIFANIGPLSAYLISHDTFARDTGVTTDSVVLVRARPLPAGPCGERSPGTQARNCSTRQATPRAGVDPRHDPQPDHRAARPRGDHRAARYRRTRSRSPSSSAPASSASSARSACAGPRSA